MGRFHSYAFNRSFIEHMGLCFSYIWLTCAVVSKVKIPLKFFVLWMELSEKQGESKRQRQMAKIKMRDDCVDY